LGLFESFRNIQEKTCSLFNTVSLRFSIHEVNILTQFLMLNRKEGKHF